MLRIVRLGRRVDEVTAQLADVLEQRAALGDHILPEAARRELLAHHHRAAADKGRAGGDHAADAVVHRQTVVHAVTRAGIDQAREPVTPLHQPVMTHIGRLRQTGRAGGVDAQRAFAERRRLKLL
jgi:hypothetical protein